MVIISDTSPITNLIQIGQLELLHALFGTITIPQSVFQELAYYEKQERIVSGCNWIIVKKVGNRKDVKQLSKYLDLGEAEAIVLAKEYQADLLIIDERRGRNAAKEEGVEIIGLLGILVRAKQAGHIVVLRPLLDKLIDEIGFRVSRRLYRIVLDTVGES
ncbi:MAG: DUF3368 domain-containing protein [Chitinophagales bacterium]